MIKSENGGGPQDLVHQMKLSSPQERVRLLLNFMEEKGQGYYDEVVTQLEHGLQCAALAEKTGAGKELLVSALLHDIGHLLVDEQNIKEGFLEQDLSHEELGADFLKAFFPAKITEPIRLHVPAKRYLCTTNRNYYEGLSDASKRSFVIQGGNLSKQEIAEFESNPALDDSLKIRIWDDQAKVSGCTTPTLTYYSDIIQQCMLDEPA